MPENTKALYKVLWNKRPKPINLPFSTCIEYCTPMTFPSTTFKNVSAMTPKHGRSILTIGSMGTLVQHGCVSQDLLDMSSSSEGDDECCPRACGRFLLLLRWVQKVMTIHHSPQTMNKEPG